MVASFFVREVYEAVDAHCVMKNANLVTSIGASFSTSIGTFRTQIKS